MEFDQLESVMADLMKKRLEIEKQAEEFESLQGQITELRKRAGKDAQARAKVVRFEGMMKQDNVRLQYDNLFARTSDVKDKLSAICEQLRLLDAIPKTPLAATTRRTANPTKARTRSFV